MALISHRSDGTLFRFIRKFKFDGVFVRFHFSCRAGRLCPTAYRRRFAVGHGGPTLQCDRSCDRNAPKYALGLSDFIAFAVTLARTVLRAYYHDP